MGVVIMVRRFAMNFRESGHIFPFRPVYCISGEVLSGHPLTKHGGNRISHLIHTATKWFAGIKPAIAGHRLHGEIRAASGTGFIADFRVSILSPLAGTVILMPQHSAYIMMTAENPHNITVEVETSYVEGQSEPDNERYVFSYTITIRNEGGEPAQLLSRHWIITDANGNIQEVKGEGVVGEQPHLNPGEGFQYTSGAMITTPVGSMRGTYQMLADSGEQFDAEIPAFTLAIPRTLH
jgi:ApaG protein